MFLVSFEIIFNTLKDHVFICFLFSSFVWVPRVSDMMPI